MTASRGLSFTETTAIIANLRGPRKRQMAMLIRFGMMTGFRIAELLSLTVGDIASDGRIRDYVTVKGCHMKGKWRPRTIRIPEVLKGELASYFNTWLHPSLFRRDKDPLFPANLGRCRAMTYMHVYRAFKAAARRACINPMGVGTHSMRKTWVSAMLAHTSDPGKKYDVLQAAGGWKNRDSMMHYIPKNEEQDEIDATQERIGKFFTHGGDAGKE